MTEDELFAEMREYFDENGIYVRDPWLRPLIARLAAKLAPAGEEWSFVFESGDYDHKNLPGVHDIDTFESRDEVAVTLSMVDRVLGIGSERYIILKRQVGPWVVQDG